MVRRAESPAKARFIGPMLLLRTDRLPEGAKWRYEIKLDGFRAVAFKIDGEVHLRDSGGLQPGEIVTVLVEDSDEHDLYAVPVNT